MGIIATASAALATSALARGLPDNQYEGRAEGDVSTYVGFDIVRNNGKRKVANVSALLSYKCQGGSGGEAFIRATGKIRVNDEGVFEGTVRSEDVPLRTGGLATRGGGPPDLTYLFKGKLKEGGRARGRIDANLFFPPERGAAPGSRCYTGELDWRARRGAEVLPIFP